MIRIDREPGSSLVQGVPFATAWTDEPGAVFTPSVREKLTDDANADVATKFERTNVQALPRGDRRPVSIYGRRRPRP